MLLAACGTVEISSVRPAAAFVAIVFSAPIHVLPGRLSWARLRQPVARSSGQAFSSRGFCLGYNTQIFTRSGPGHAALEPTARCSRQDYRQ